MRVVFILLILFLFGCANDADYKEKFEEHFIEKELITSGVGCGTEEDVEAYRLAELFFKNDETLTFKLRVIVFTNGLPTFPDEIIKTRMAHVNQFFDESKAGIRYEIDTIIFIEDLPLQVPSALTHIKKVEDVALRGKEDISLRSSFKMTHYRLWDRLYSEEGFINMYIYNDDEAEVAGIAGGIGATFFAVGLRYIHPQLKVVEHELGHCNGLYHTHQPDQALKNSVYTGDRIAATPISPILSNVIGDDCELVTEWQENLNPESYIEDSNRLKNMTKGELSLLIRNVMSYSRGVCRKEFLPSQVLRMKKTIETSADLRRAIVGLEESYSDLLWEQTMADYGKKH